MAMGGASMPHVLFFPFMTKSHITSMLDMAVRFATFGARATVLATPGDADFIRSKIHDRPSLRLLLLPTPSSDLGLLDDVDASVEQEQICFFAALDLLRLPFERLLREERPSCIVSDMFLHWTAASAAAVGVPRLVFHGMGFAAICTAHAIDLHMRGSGSGGGGGGEGELFPPAERDGYVEILGLPRRVELRRDQLMQTTAAADWFGELMREIWASERLSYGAVVNSFYELEAEYAEHYRSPAIGGLRAWHVGPTLPWPPSPAAANDACLAWLSSKPASSVVYVCFGTIFRPNTAQLHEIVRGLDASGKSYIFVARGEGWLPEQTGDEGGSSEGRLVVRGWAPQAAILGHPSTGAFLSHCGWSSVLEAVRGGVPVITWPVYGDQFDNQRLVADELGMGVRVGPEAWGCREEGAEMASADEVTAAVRRVMEGEEATQMRRRAAEMKEKAKMAVEEGGSSFRQLNLLIHYLADTFP